MRFKGRRSLPSVMWECQVSQEKGCPLAWEGRAEEMGRARGSLVGDKMKQREESWQHPPQTCSAGRDRRVGTPSCLSSHNRKLREIDADQDRTTLDTELEGWGSKKRKGLQKGMGFKRGSSKE